MRTSVGQQGTLHRDIRLAVRRRPIRIRRLLTCPCQNGSEAKSFATFDLEAATVAPELAYVTAR
jgi:hypothetical protein